MVVFPVNKNEDMSQVNAMKGSMFPFFLDTTYRDDYSKKKTITRIGAWK